MLHLTDTRATLASIHASCLEVSFKMLLTPQTRKEKDQREMPKIRVLLTQATERLGTLVTMRSP